MANLETVYAIHNFEAENDDELSFDIGEPVIVLQKDDGFGDGWWKGQNINGVIGLFPMNYVSKEDFQRSQYPASTISGSTRKNIKHHHSNVISEVDYQNGIRPDSSVTSSLDSSYTLSDYSQPITATTAPSLNFSSYSTSTTASNQLKKNIVNTFYLPDLKKISPEYWDIDQVSIWLHAMGFSTVVENFKCQEITGDVLLELNMNALKELDVPTFGKRFKIQNAINILREEWFSRKSQNRISIASSTLSDIRKKARSTIISPSQLSFATSNCKCTLPSCCYSHKENRSYNNRSNKMRTIHYEEEDEDEDDEDEYLPITPMSPTSHPVSTFYDHPKLFGDKYAKTTIVNSNIPYHEAIATDISKSGDKFDPSTTFNINETLLNINKPQTVLPMAHHSSMNIYSQKNDEDNLAPDMEGWLQKQSYKYKRWNKRWFVLKGPNLFYFKSPKDVRMKGIINLRGYKIIPDETICPGYYSFKAQHEEERTFYFYTEQSTSMRSWITNLMKATISRDFNAPVLSSSVIPTVSLDIALRMRPRPPSVLLYKKENLKNSNLPPRSYEATYEGVISRSKKPNNVRTSREEAESDNQVPSQDSGFDSDVNHAVSVQDNRSQLDDDDATGDEGVFGLSSSMNSPDNDIRTNSEYINWVNSICSTKITSLEELDNNDNLMEIIQNLSRHKLLFSDYDSVFEFIESQGFKIDNECLSKEDKFANLLHAIMEWSRVNNNKFSEDNDGVN